MIQPPPPHPLVRWVNRVAPALRPLHGYGHFDPLRLSARAVARTGLDDFGDDDYVEGLHVLCESARREADLTIVGTVGLEEQIINALITRLRRVQALRQGRIGVGKPLNRPLVVMGLPRSGTTYLHRLLALDPAARALRTWEVREPFAPRGWDLRPWRTRGKVWALKLAAPGIDAKHRVDADQAEECIFLHDSSFRSSAYWIVAPVYSYLAWLRDQDMGPAYDAYRELLEHFQRQRPNARLTLKAPAHAAELGVLVDRVPEACLVQTHRDPVPIASSVNSLFLSFHGGMAHSLDVARMVEANLTVLDDLAQRSMDAREQLPAGAVLDVQYEAIVTQPVAAVRRIYAHFDLPFTARYEGLLDAAVTRRTQTRHGRHRYRAEDFGMTDAELAHRFAAYRNWLTDMKPSP